MGTPSGVARKSSISSMDDRSDYQPNPDEDAQREQDLDAARLMSRARVPHGDGPVHDTSAHWHDDDGAHARSPANADHAGSIPIRARNVAEQFYRRQRRGSNASVDSGSHFIDHRNQSHSLSMNPNSPLAMRAMQNAPSMYDSGNAARSPHTHTPRAMRGESAAPPINYAALSSSQEAPASPVAEEGAPTSELANSTHTETDRGREDDVCFPAASNIDDVVQDERKEPAALDSPPPGYPYTFDLSAVETFCAEERGHLGTTNNWPEVPAVGSPTEKHRGTYRGGHYGKPADTGDSTLYSRRPRQPVEGQSQGNKFQRKLAAFEGGHSFGSSFAPSSHMSAAAAAAEPADEPARPLLKGTSQHTYHGVTQTEPSANDLRTRGRAYSQPFGNGRSKTQPLAHAMADKPYRFTFYSNALPTTIHARYLSELPAQGQSFEDLLRGIVPEHEKKAEEAAAKQTAPVPLAGALPRDVQPEQGLVANSDPSTWWLDVLCPTDQEMKVLSRTFGIHPLTTEDILMEETREKIELFRNYYLVCFRSFDQDPYSPTYLEPLNMYIIVFREGTLSFHFRHTPHPQNVRRRIKQLKDYINVTSDWISYALIDDITDAFGPLIQGIEFEVDSIDELVLILKEAEQTDMLRRIGTCRKKVMGLLRLMGNKADVVKGLAKRCNEYWAIAPRSDIGLYLSDIQDHLITMTQNLNHYEMILSRSHSNYLAQISIEMTDANNQINDVLSKLTALGTVIVPMNVITGLWGMNVHVPGQDVSNLHWFGGICAVMVVIAVSGYITTVRYLERR
ncbi:hypothetical protein CBS9595_003120 [Malassezia furfur]|nr:hypothetical protein CBS9595_003120 [Malassezia furfur]